MEKMIGNARSPPLAIAIPFITPATSRSYIPGLAILIAVICISRVTSMAISISSISSFAFTER
jgi:hypothetical protein